MMVVTSAWSPSGPGAARPRGAELAPGAGRAFSRAMLLALHRRLGRVGCSRLFGFVFSEQLRALAFKELRFKMAFKVFS